MNRGSPGAGKPHAGKYRELPLLRQRGGGGQDIPLTSALPTQSVDRPPSGDGSYMKSDTYFPYDA